MENVANTISASRVPAVLGLDKRVSPLTFYLRAKGAVAEKDLSQDDAVLEGRFYEKATAELCCHKNGMQIVPGFEQLTMVSGVLSGHPDFGVIDEHGKLAPLEVKNPFWSYAGAENDDDWGEPGTDEVPRAHYVQTLVYQELFRAWWEANRWPGATTSGVVDIPSNVELADYGYVAVKLRGGVERFKVPYTPAIIAKIRSECDMMLERIRMDDPPDFRDESDVRLRWQGDPEKTASCNLDMVEILKAHRNLGDRIRALEVERSTLAMKIIAHAQDCGTIEFQDHNRDIRKVVATVNTERAFNKEKCLAQYRDDLIAKGYMTVDTTKLRKEQKSLYDQFMEIPAERAHQKRVIRHKKKAQAELDNIYDNQEGDQ